MSETVERKVRGLFAADGALAQALPGFQAREAQLALALEITRAMEGGDSLIAEAETGTGKTLAYLIPALVGEGKVLISTHTKALQDQLMHRDIPAVQRALGRNRAIALLKGRSNYLCPHRLQQALTSHQMELWMESPLLKVKQWGERSRDGDLSGLGFDPFVRGIGGLITATAEQCLGSKCGQFSRCPLMSARQKAHDADVVISNHSLLLADARLKAGEFGAVLPDFDHYVIDEAHGLPKLASQHFGVQLGRRRLMQWLRDVQLALEEQGDEPALMAELAEAGAALLQQWTTWELAALSAGWDAAVAPFFKAEFDDDELIRLDARARSICADFAAVAEPEPGFVAWEDGEGDFRRWQAAPVETGPVLDRYLWQIPASFVLLSATFRVSNSFAYIKHHVGLPEALESYHSSPFDYPSQALIYLPRHLIPGGDERLVVEAMESLLRASSGRAFVLFTAHSALRRIAPQLAQQLPWPVLIQGEGVGRDALLQQFRQQGNSVLCGTRSFWEGVDVPGAALSMVIIDKMPFAPPNDPLLAERIRRCEADGGNGFRDIQLPEAIAVLRQGVGRLIRSEQDRGVMAILDSRLRQKFYGREVLRNLPPAPLCDDLAEVRWFFESE
ncbi:MAG: ATP-dependent DNA helicase [Mariprofundales bacterium]|nr:ATP-dependent DNA helicase [Mariprofundales bacterium]